MSFIKLSLLLVTSLIVLNLPFLRLLRTIITIVYATIPPVAIITETTPERNIGNLYERISLLEHETCPSEYVTHTWRIYNM